jgi:hypothetical protein
MQANKRKEGQVDKTVYSGTILICLTLLAGSIWFPDNAAMWLASTSIIMNVGRVLIVGLMLGLVFTDPPRQRNFRLLLSGAALVFLIAALQHLYSGSVQLIDALLFFEAAVAFGIAAVEGNVLAQPAEPAPQSRLLGQQYRTMSDSQGLVVPQRRLSHLFTQTVLIVSVMTGALYENTRPVRVLWRGS